MASAGMCMVQCTPRVQYISKLSYLHISYLYGMVAHPATLDAHVWTGSWSGLNTITMLYAMSIPSVLGMLMAGQLPLAHLDVIQ